MRSSLPKTMLAKEFDIEIRGRESVFDALVREGKAASFLHAVEIVGRHFPPPGGGRWRDLVEWVEDYEGQERRPEGAGGVPTKIPCSRPVAYQQASPPCGLSPAGSRRALSETKNHK